MATVKPAMTEDYEEHSFDPEWQENGFKHSAKASPLTMLMQCEVLTKISFDQIHKMEIFRIVVHHMVQLYYIDFVDMSAAGHFFFWYVNLKEKKGEYSATCSTYNDKEILQLNKRFNVFKAKLLLTFELPR